MVLSDLEGDDIILCQITSRATFDKYAIPIFENDFLEGKLSVDSFIKPNKIFTADKNIILYRACSINKIKVNEVIEIIIKLLSI